MPASRFSPRTSVVLLPLIGAVAGMLACATTRPNAEPLPTVPASPTPMVAAAPAPAPEPKAPACEAFVRPGVLRRSAVVRVVDAGVGKWLAGGAEVKERLVKARFQGWEIRRLYPGDPCYQLVDLRPGDVVTQVNGKPIEKPEQAFAVLNGLRTDAELLVDYLRDGQAKKLSLTIENE
jgi:S1-C subfamily serine protease